MTKEEVTGRKNAIKGMCATIQGCFLDSKMKEVKKLAIEDFIDCIHEINPKGEKSALADVRICVDEDEKIYPILHATVLKVEMGLVFKKMVAGAVLLYDKNVCEIDGAMTMPELEQILKDCGGNGRAKDIIKWIAVCECASPSIGGTAEAPICQIKDVAGIRGGVDNKFIVLKAKSCGCT